uniref:Uncharacterized protein LOC114347819 n=1 Tax=Diabrotica virgifera virgifera TaxID=50390 RepID=A0A6P7HEW0_DIAVI
MPMTIRRCKLGSQFLIKLLHKESNLIEKIHRLSIQDLMNKYWQKKKSPCIAECYRQLAKYKENIHTTSINLSYTYKFEETMKIDINFLRDYSKYPKQIRNLMFETDIKELVPNSYQIYTDASKNKEGTACAIYDPQVKYKKMVKLNINTNIYSAELIGILEALKYCQHIVTNSEIVIISDSKSALSKIKIPTTPQKTRREQPVQYMIHKLSIKD